MRKLIGGPWDGAEINELYALPLLLMPEKRDYVLSETVPPFCKIEVYEKNADGNYEYRRSEQRDSREV